MKTTQHTNAIRAGNFHARSAVLAERNDSESTQLIELDVLDLGRVSGGFSANNPPPPPSIHNK